MPPLHDANFTRNGMAFIYVHSAIKFGVGYDPIGTPLAYGATRPGELQLRIIRIKPPTHGGPRAYLTGTLPNHTTTQVVYYITTSPLHHMGMPPNRGT